MSLFNPCAADQPALWTLWLPPGHQGVEGGLGGPGRHTDRDISETNSIHNTLVHLEEYYDLTKESLVKVSIRVATQKNPK